MIKRGEFYPLGDRLTFPERRSFGLPVVGGVTVEASVVARWTGERRNPTAGEWYLSGAITTAYRAPSNLREPHYLAELVKIRVETRIVEDLR